MVKKLIWDTCNKTTFTSNGEIYEQANWVSMKASLGPVLANNNMTELERVVLDDLMKAGIIKSYKIC